MDSVNTEVSSADRRQQAKRIGIGLGVGTAALLLGASIQQTITKGDETVRFPARERECVFDNDSKPAVREPEEGLGSLAVRTIPGVNWGQCVDEAQVWISEHNPEIKDTSGETIYVPVQAFVE